MPEIFLRFVNMSISASYIVLAVLLLRVLLKKAPRRIAVALWGIAALRLVCPFSVKSVVSLIPSAEAISPSIMTDTTPAVNTGIAAFNSIVNPVISESLVPNPADSVNPLQIWITLMAAVWVLVMLGMLAYAVISFVRIKRRVETAVIYKDNIYQSENVPYPFVLGIIKPKIYMPFNIKDGDMVYVEAHERAHIKRKDHLWKLLGFVILTLHWFNPLVWLGYAMLCRDIELACDEAVIKGLDRNSRADYSQALLFCSVERRALGSCPLAFGEVGVKMRVKSILNYKKPAFWIIAISVVASVAVAVCFLTDPVSDGEHPSHDSDKLSDEQIALMEKYPELFYLDASAGLDVYVSQMAPSAYSFRLFPHSEVKRGYEELLGYPATYAAEMRVILSSYDVDESEIYIVPWQNPISSYLGDLWVVREGEEPQKKLEAYIDNVKKMILPSE